ncbi:T-complex protein 1 subunit theta [Thelohanellus kitauei]|uniref:T-complex protein 1 subunit theta n=1 Tax=Thelohanellus kitauei TaxID=669202 RepID=A0A0C2MRD2_THEKT|nr:T-complex protein 1 subunit theta [Thelohanellus kitauei]
MNTANELLNFSAGEEGMLKNSIKELKDLGCNVVVCSGKVSDEALDYSNRLNILVVQITSKFELQRLCRATSSSPLPLYVKPQIEQLGHCKHVYVKEIGDSNVVLFSQESEESAVSTLIIRGSSTSILDDIERAVDDGINCYKSLTFNPKLLPGAGAIEMALCVELEKLSSEAVGYQKLTLSKFCEALKNLVRTIAQNNGMKSNEVVSKLHAAHLGGDSTAGLDVETSTEICEVVEKGILEPLYGKKRCFQLVLDAVSTILSIDHIIVARPAGGPVPKQNPGWDQD